MSPAAPHHRPEASRPFSSASVRFVKQDGSEYSHPSVNHEVEEPRARPPSAPRVYAVSSRDGSPIVSRAFDGIPGYVGVKRTKSPLHQRDSLKSRMSPQRAGSRRRQRWERERDILRGQELTAEEVRELYQVNTTSLFSELFEDGEIMAQWQQFCSKSEEDQEGLCRAALQKKCAGPKMTQDPAELYCRMSSRARGMLERGVGLEFLEQFEQALVSLVYGDDLHSAEEGSGGVSASPMLTDESWSLSPSGSGAKVTLSESLERMVCHQMCVYYSLSSSSYSVQQGHAKTLFISWSSPPPLPPTSSLTQYLRKIAA